MEYTKDRVNMLFFDIQEELQEILKQDETNEIAQSSNKTNQLQEKMIDKIINYGIENAKEDIEEVVSEVLKKYDQNKKVKIYKNSSNDFSIIPTKETTEESKINIHVPLTKEGISKNLSKIIDFLIKSKINYRVTVSSNLKIDTVIISVTNPDDAKKVTKFINSTKEISKNMYDFNPLFVSEEKVFLSINFLKLSYANILSKYIFSFIYDCIKQNKTANIVDFEKYMYANLLELQSKYDLSEQLKITGISTEYQQSLIELEYILELMCANLKNIVNGTNFNDIFYSQYDELNKRKDSDEYKDFSDENFTNDSQLLKEIVEIMTYKYGYDYTKRAINNYRNAGIFDTTKASSIKNTSGLSDGLEYITREKDLRKRVKQAKSFRTYLNKHTQEELECLFERAKPTLSQESVENVKTTEEMLLEQICKEIYQSCNTPENEFQGKIQVAVALIKMSNGNYNYVTRNNNARKIAQENIKPENVVKILKKALRTTGYIIENEEDLYELYATHIEYLCTNQHIKRGK